MTPERLNEIIFQCEYATRHSGFAMVSTAEVSEIVKELLEARELLKTRWWKSAIIDLQNKIEQLEKELEIAAATSIST